MIKRKLSLLDIKQALFDEKFRGLFPELSPDIEKALSDPGCPCNRSIYLKFLDFKDRLERYFPNKVVEQPEEEKPPENHWTVLNCHVDGLEMELRKLPPGRKQLAVSRYEDQVTVVVNNLDIF